MRKTLCIDGVEVSCINLCFLNAKENWPFSGDNSTNFFPFQRVIEPFYVPRDNNHWKSKSSGRNLLSELLHELLLELADAKRLFSLSLLVVAKENSPSSELVIESGLEAYKMLKTDSGNVWLRRQHCGIFTGWDFLMRDEGVDWLSRVGKVIGSQVGDPCPTCEVTASNGTSYWV